MASGPTLSWGRDDPQLLRDSYRAERAAIRSTCCWDVDQVPYASVTGPAIAFLPKAPQNVPIVYFHGGGWVAGSPDTHVTLCSWLAYLTNRRVLSVPYGLAPEYQFPSQVHDAARALDDILLREDQVIVAGDSAGGAMAFWAESHALRRDRVVGVVSLYGGFGAFGTQSGRRFEDTSDGLSADDRAGMYARLGCPGGTAVAAAIADQGAPALLITAGADPLADDHAYLMAQKPNRQMHEVIIPDQPHAFLQFAGSDSVAQAAMQTTADWINQNWP